LIVGYALPKLPVNFARASRSARPPSSGAAGSTKAATSTIWLVWQDLPAFVQLPLSGARRSAWTVAQSTSAQAAASSGWIVGQSEGNAPGLGPPGGP
jgi:hypothetical protein